MKPERDPRTCAMCDEPARVATPMGGLCRDHASKLADSEGL